MHSVIQELIDNSIVNEALVSKDNIPSVDPQHPQNLQGAQSDSFGADGTPTRKAGGDSENDDDGQQRENERRSFQKQAECLTACMSLAEYHCESLMECGSLKEMENAVSERLKLAAQMLKTAKEYVTEIEAGYVAQPPGSGPQPSSASRASQSSASPQQ
jgi:hypothetical protein